jgi:hypothetical protein
VRSIPFSPKDYVGDAIEVEIKSAGREADCSSDRSRLHAMVTCEQFTGSGSPDTY